MRTNVKHQQPSRIIALFMAGGRDACSNRNWKQSICVFHPGNLTTSESTTAAQVVCLIRARQRENYFIQPNTCATIAGVRETKIESRVVRPSWACTIILHCAAMLLSTETDHQSALIMRRASAASTAH